MPIVFVHGVRTRQGPDNDRAVAQRAALFRRHLLDGVAKTPADVAIHEPHWGHLGARFAWDLGSVPDDGAADVALGGATAHDVLDAAGAELAAAAPADTHRSELLLALARQRGLGAAVDLVAVAAAHGTAADVDDLADFGARAAPYADADDDPAWLAGVADDRELLDRLLAEIRPATGGGEASLGLGDKLLGALQEGLDRVKQVAVPIVGRPAYAAVRRMLVPTIATFVGDVFAYQTRRGTPAEPGPIPTVVIEALRTAAAQRVPGSDPLLVIGHSMGGVIAHDVLGSFAAEVPVDALVTVGSQVGLFEEMKLFHGSRADVPGAGGAKAARPAGAAAWINVFDHNDVLSFRAAPVFEGVAEFAYATAELFTAHGAYFSQPRLHERLRVRLREAGVTA